jgi:CO/xanthine dehydrogenase FAD-binding subunit
VAPSDIAPVLVALRASVEIVGPAAGRFLPVEDMYRNDGLAHLALDPGEIVAAVLVPDAEGWGSAYQKLRLRESLDFQSASAAAALRREGDRVVDARVVIGGVAARPLRCTEAEEALLESTPTDADFTRAAAAAARRAHPVPNADLAAGYRKKMIAPLAARSLREAWRRAGASKPTSGE